MSLNKHLTGTNIALVSVFAGFIAASTLWGGVPLGSGVPITLQTFAVLLAGAALGPWRGASAVVLYLVLGTAGVPIFAEHRGGAAVWASTTAGFLVGFVFCAFATGWIVRGMRRRGQLTLAGLVGASAFGSLFVLNLIGWSYVALRAGLTVDATVAIATPFLVGDIVKVFAAAAVAAAVHRAYPGLLGTNTHIGRRADATGGAGTFVPDAEDAVASA